MRAVLLDIDDTLVDTRAAFRHALKVVAGEYLQADADGEQVLQHWRDDRNGWYRAHTRGEISRREQRMRRANDLHATFGGPMLDDDGFESWDALFEKGFQAGWSAHDDAHVLLAELDARGIVYGSVSNADSAYQTLKLAACGLGMVPMLVGVDTFGVGKPDPRVFIEGARLLGVRVDETAYIGDEPDIDAMAASAVGMAGIWLDRPGARRARELHPPAGITRVSGLSEVPDVLWPE